MFLLLRSNPSLLGLGYLGLCIAIFLNPPLRGEFEERDEMGRVVEGPESTVTKIYRGCWSAAGNHESPAQYGIMCIGNSTCLSVLTLKA